MPRSCALRSGADAVCKKQAQARLRQLASLLGKVALMEYVPRVVDTQRVRATRDIVTPHFSAEESMVLTKSELIGSLQNEVRILLHLAGKIDRAQLDYRPTPKQRSTLELISTSPSWDQRSIEPSRRGNSTRPRGRPPEQAAEARTSTSRSRLLPGSRTRIAALLADMSDADLRAEIDMFGTEIKRGAVHRQSGALRVRGIPHAVVPLPQGLRPRGAEHDEPVGRHRRPGHHIVRRVRHLSRRSQHPPIQRGVAADVYRRLGPVPP